MEEEEEEKKETYETKKKRKEKKRIIIFFITLHLYSYLRFISIISFRFEKKRQLQFLGVEIVKPYACDVT